MPIRTARRRGKDENPPEAGWRSRTHATPAFLLPEDNEPDARDDPMPEWTRPPTDWREEYDLIADRFQRFGLTRPGAPGPGNPCALRLKLPGPRAAARPVEPGTTHDDRAWIKHPHLFTSRLDGGWNVFINRTSRRIGTLAKSGGQIELRRNDQWSTLLAVVPQDGAEQLLEPPLLRRTLGLAHLVFSARWPPGPPTLRRPDEYSKRKRAAPAPKRTECTPPRNPQEPATTRTSRPSRGPTGRPPPGPKKKS